MPGGDRTGPMGEGAMSGRGLGYCGGYAAPGFANSAPGRGWGRAWRRGRGRGWGRGRQGLGPWGWGPGNWVPAYGGEPDFAPPLPDQEIRNLEARAEYLKNTLEGIRRRITDLRAQTGKEE